MTDQQHKELETLQAEHDRELDLYYSTKRMCNRTSDVDRILEWWKKADSHWQRAQQLKQEIAAVAAKQGD